MSRNYNNFVQLLKDKLSTMPNESLYIMVNSSFFKKGSSMILARYSSENGRAKLQVGRFVSIDNKRVFLDSPEYLEDLFSMCYNTKLFGIDFANDIHGDANIPVINIYGELRVLEIRTQIYHLLFQKIYHENENIQFQKTGRTLTQQERLDLIGSFDDYAFQAYLGAMSDRFYDVITSPRNRSLVFYRQLGSFVPLFVTGPCLYNPLVENRLYKDIVTQSKIYKTANLIEKEYNGLIINFITHKKICESLGLSNFTKMPFRFVTQILFGFFKPQYPNKNTYIYVRTSTDDTLPAELSEEEFSHLSPAYKPDYRRFNSLYIHCYRYRANVGAPNETELYRLIEQARLVV